MNYYSIEWHTHTVHSDADQTVAQLLDTAAKSHYEILSISDHNTLSAYAEIAEKGLTTPVFLLHNSLEWTTFYGHLLVLGVREALNWYDAKPTEIDLWVKKNKEAGAVLGIAHPYELGSPICTGCHWDFLVRNWDNFDFIEILNGDSPQEQDYNQKAYTLWSELLRQGHHLAASCGRDWHRLKKETANVAVNYLGVEHLDEESIKASIRQGNFYITLGPKWELSLSSKEQPAIFMGATITQGTYHLAVKFQNQDDDFNRQFGETIKKIKLLQNEEVIAEFSRTAFGAELKTEVVLTPGPFRIEAWGAFKENPDQRLVISNPFYVE
ncbi:CehA/McbA family metallohydrolase [Liquorilactobacillus satsumensis]|uniref:CehA/McbA family metallohydrolase n=1 Tax=Liquorilactobacillus satsumensis TaxID=259059 RepID=UPI0021C2C4A8|nr:CehA/McbA family metallohydrolase [Liquorilactobacillus satsumensis]MCP9311734.1 CehA/McbA family metallohydrolase [Liquorilactobacillus satsumensis]MCP9358867.1 CehA/McbA family metallohydrolase [Liquorilactobacillus satsumensis]